MSDPKMFKDIGVIPSTDKFMVVDQARVAPTAFHSSYTEAIADAEARAEACNGKAELWCLLRVVPDALPEDKETA